MVKEHSDVGPVYELAYRADGTQMLVFDNKTIRLLDAVSGQVLAEMTDAREIQAAIFSPDGKFVISSSHGDIRIWDAETHQTIGDLKGGDGDIQNLAITADNRYIVADDFMDEGAFGLWPGPAAWPDLLCAKLTQNMSDKQWNEWVGPGIPYTAACPGLPKAPDQAPG